MPYFAEAHNYLGNALKELGQLEDAVASYNKAIIGAPDYAEAHMNLGDAFKKLGDYDEAIKSYILADPNYVRQNISAIILECYYFKNDMAAFQEHLRKISLSKDYNFRAGAASAFVAQQLCDLNIYEFCNNPIGLVTAYNILEDDQTGDNIALLKQLEKDISKGDLNRQFSPGHISNGYKSIDNLFVDSTEQIFKLDILLRRFINYYFESHCSKRSLFIDYWPLNYDLDGWYIQLDRGGEISAHVHTGWASGVLYLRTPKNRSHDEGNIEFTLRGFDLPVIQDNYPRKTVETAPGVLVLFPSSLPHRVIPFSSNEERICIAFDMKPRQAD